MQALRCKRTGINVPVALGEDIVGVIVGITGEPDEVRGYGELVKDFVELMLQQALLTEESQKAETGGLRTFRSGSPRRQRRKRAS